MSWIENTLADGSVVPLQIYSNTTMVAQKAQLDSVDIIPKSSPIVDNTNLYGGELAFRCDSFYIEGRLQQVGGTTVNCPCDVEIQRIGSQIFYKIDTRDVELTTTLAQTSYNIVFPSLTTQDEKDDFATAYMPSKDLTEAVVYADGPTEDNIMLVGIRSFVSSPADPTLLVRLVAPDTYLTTMKYVGADEGANSGFILGSKIGFSSACWSWTK